jgi:hypothetical protein
VQLRSQWRRVVFHPPIFWLLVAIELMLFATAVHSVAGRVFPPRCETTLIDIPAAFLTPATEDTAIDQTARIAGATSAESATDNPNNFPPGALQWQRTYGNYNLRCYSGGFRGDEYVASQFEIWQGDALVYTNSEYVFFAPQDGVADTNEGYEAEADLPLPGSDLTGRGQPDVVIHEYSGGAHCCSTYRIFELGDTFREVAVIEAQHGEIEFVDLDGNGIPVIELQDWSYAYEFTGFADSYAPDVVLRFKDDQYVMAPDLMTTPALSDAELVAKAAEVKEAYREVDQDGSVSLSSPATWSAGGGALWNAMLELLYTGHEDEALRLFNLAWPEWARGKRRALRKFVKTVGASEYWPQMTAASSVTPE